MYFFQPIFQFSTNGFSMIFSQSLSMASITNFQPIAFPLQRQISLLRTHSLFFPSICQERRFCGNQVAATFRGKCWIEMSRSQLQKWPIHEEDSEPSRQANKPRRPKILFCGTTCNVFKDRLCPWTRKEIIARQQIGETVSRRSSPKDYPRTLEDFFVFVFPAVAQIMLCLSKRECFDSQAKNCRQSDSKCCLLCNMLQCAVKICLTTNAIIPFLVRRSQTLLVFVLQ